MRECLLLSVLLVACGSTPPADPTLTQVQTQVFKISCALSSSCHSGSNPMEGLNLDAPAYAKIVNVAAMEVPTKKLVVAGSLTASFLYDKVASAKPESGEQMPLGGQLDANQLALLQGWIMSGAPNN